MKRFMRRYLFVFSCLVFCLSLFCIPAFAIELQPFAQSNISGQQTFIAVSGYQSPLYCVLNLDGENNPSFSGWIDVPDIYGDLNSYELPNSPYTLYITFDDATNDLMVTIEDGAGRFYDGTGTIYFYLSDPNAPVDPEPSGNFLQDVGSFFSFAMNSLAGVFGVIFSSAPLFILCIASPIVGFAVALLSRFKKL